ncbi:MAG: class I SAM-dependent methyltransferase [Nanoarchaeota archaeon]
MVEHYYNKDQKSKLVKTQINVSFFDKNFKLITASGIFSVGRVDRGTIILLNNCIIEDFKKVLDLGCGCGIVGISIANSFKNCNVVMSDVNKRAIAISKQNIKLNNLENIKAIQSDCFLNINEKFDFILLNPPQSAGKDVCLKMIEESYNYLNNNGSLQIVVRKNKGGNTIFDKMNEVFNNIDVLAKKSGYWVCISRK